MTEAGPHPGTPARRPRGPHVTAVVVTRGDTEYLGPTLAAVLAQERPPDRLLVVDVSAEPSPTVPDLVRQLRAGAVAAGPEPGGPSTEVVVLSVPRARTFGAGVRGALVPHGAVPHGPAADDDAADGPARREPWLWLLHDDSAPEPGALAALLHAVELAPSVVVAGPKQRTWSGPARVLEAGVWTSRFGRRMTGLDGPEVDQGQHDGREDVLAVGLAGALVRRDVWDALGGPDPALGPYGDGLDLSRRARLAGHRVVVVPQAVVRHAQASLAEPLAGAVLHRPGWDRRRAVRARREAYLHAQLTGVPLPLVPVVAVLAVLSSLVRALGRLVLKEPHLVGAELLAPWNVLVRPGRVARARRTAARTRRLPRRSLRPLQVGWREVARQARDRRLTAAEVRRRQDAPSELELRELAVLRRRRRAGLAVVLLAALALTTATVGRLVTRVVAGERLTGGALALGDAGVGEVWALVLSGRVPAGLGHAAPTDPALVALLPLAGLTGSVGRAATLLLLAAPVLAALGAWYAAGAATRSVGLRAWAALAWTVGPALTLGVNTGRWGGVLAHLLLPWVVLGVARGVGVARTDAVVPGTDRGTDAAPVVRRAPASLAAVAAGSLALAGATAGAPVLLLAVVPAVLVLLPAVPLRRRLLWLPVPALALHGPLLVAAAGRWGDGGWRTLLTDPGLPVPSTTAPAWQVLLGWPVDPGAAREATGNGVAAAPDALVELLGPWVPVLLLAGSGVLAVVALVGLAIEPAAVAARAGWALVAVGVLTGLLVARVEVARADDVLVTAWPGAAATLVLTGLLVAAVPAADGVRAVLARHSFGWRQATAGLLAALAMTGPAVLGTAWVWSTLDAVGPDGRTVAALRASDVPVVPAAGRQIQSAPEAARVLLLDPSAADDVTASLLGRDGRQLTALSRAVTAQTVRGGWGAAQPADPDRADEQLAQGVGRLVAGADDDVAPDLAALAVGAVLVPPAAEDASAEAVAARGALVAQLDGTSGLERVTETASGIIWRVAVTDRGTTTAWARLADDAAGTPAVVPARDGAVRTAVEASGRDRLLVLAERADPGWRAELDGRPLRAVQSGWQQAFEVGRDDGLLTVEHVAPSRGLWAVVQGVVLVVALLLAVPVRRRRGGAR